MGAVFPSRVIGFFIFAGRATYTTEKNFFTAVLSAESFRRWQLKLSVVFPNTCSQRAISVFCGKVAAKEKKESG
ncbi:MAG TPA: hypothetical protein PLV05_10245 [Verrucomicrobiota bacterium]|nr:hypothetical protein [Verrucomicrobiota bacterium]HRR65042.1 hypothetical protein [Candidatus Paceibacterota bacterium]HOF71207.1 hypothetical protein [Verrucomicrobiota bacterium]HOM45750.1 hypothetical protein [Verrucomicrobiota bacterium]HOQ56717.1 hypothetical protein [Verrucomicrobiota bacterium]